MECFDKLILLSGIVGMLGDASLQQLVKTNVGKNWGLIPYFQQHGSIESLFIAGGMMALFTAFYLIILRLPPFGWIYLAIYGVILDLLFRKLMIFPSLQGYYNSLNYFESALWGAIPMLLPSLIYYFFFQ